MTSALELEMKRIATHFIQPNQSSIQRASDLHRSKNPEQTDSILDCSAFDRTIELNQLHELLSMHTFYKFIHQKSLSINIDRFSKKKY
jgi:hypothetical protein